MIAFKASVFGEEGSWYWREGNKKSVAILRNTNVCRDSNFSHELISCTVLSLLLSSGALVVTKCT